MDTIRNRPLIFTLVMGLLILAVSSCLTPPARNTVPLQPDGATATAPDTTPPQVAITVAPPKTVTSDNVTFEWTGSDDRTPSDKLTYSYYLKGRDQDYSSFTSDTTKTYSNLSDGTYTFLVKSHDEADNVSTTSSVTFTVSVPKPQKTEIMIPVISPIVSTLLIVPDSDVSYISVGYDNTVYAVDSPHARLYKSEHGGYGWTEISRNLGASGPWTGLAIAPDDPRVVAVVTNAGTEVFLSTDGGNNFGSTGLGSRLAGTERVECIAISSGYSSRDIAVGTSRGNGNGKVWVNIMEGFPSGWQDMSTGAAGWIDADIFAIDYSPSFDSDGTIVAVAATGPSPGTENTYLYMGIRDVGGNTTVWNNSSGYPVQISQSGQDTPGTPLRYADLALPADYNGASPANRHVYACWTDNPPGLSSAGNPNDDVYRIDDTVCYRLYVRSDVPCSLAHYGIYSRGKLLAGAVAASTVSLFRGPQVYFTANPMSQYPTWQNSQKPPTGPGQARVAWSADGRVAYCGTSAFGGGNGDQSAFSITTNNGFTWNQIGLIDL
ncbi:MAG TPA: triple tyrosine motif-containing protein [Dehalococcoidia bacterium]